MVIPAIDHPPQANSNGVLLINHCLAQSECRNVDADDAGAHITNIGHVRRTGILNGAEIAVFAEEFGAFAQG